MKLPRWVRILAGISAIAAAFTGHAGFLLACIVVEAVLSAWEIVFIALIFDLLWAPPFGIHALPWYTMGSLALLWAIEPLRREFLS